MIEVYQGDTQEWRWKLTRSGTPLPSDELSGATAVLDIPGLGISNASLAIYADSDYPFVYEPSKSDTQDVEGTYIGYITVTFADGDIETWPVTIKVHKKEA